MPIRIIVAGATGWVGRALVPAILKADGIALVGAVSRSAAGRDLGEVLGGTANGVTTSATIEEALQTPCDVLVDYTKPGVVKHHVMAAVNAGRHVVIGTSGLGAEDYAEIDGAARARGVGVVAAGNFSITATLLQRFALEAARLVPDVEIIDYASAKKPDAPSGTARELAERLSEVRGPASSLPVADVSGVSEARGGTVGRVQVHALRMPGFVLSCEAVFGMEGERLVIRHDAGASAEPYIGGTLLAVRRVVDRVGLVRGLDALLQAATPHG